MSAGYRLEQVFKNQFGLTVGINRLLRHVLRDGQTLRDAVGGAGGGEDEFFEVTSDMEEYEKEENAQLIPRIPQPRKRKVSIYDLVGALQKALEVKKRRVIRSIPDAPLDIPEMV